MKVWLHDRRPRLTSYRLEQAIECANKFVSEIKDMRLTKPQLKKINRIIRAYTGKDSKVYLFGSRTNDAARGGDVDLLIITPRAIPRLQRARLKVKLESALGLPVDILVKRENNNTSFEKIALNNAQLLTKEQAE